ERNPALSILAPHAERPDFHVIAVILTHFHTDHYSGLVEVLDLCDEAARRHGREGHEILDAFCLPASYKAFFERIEEDSRHDGGVGQGHLRKLLKRLSELKLRTVEFKPHQFAWRRSAQERLGDEEWIFNFYPDSEIALEEVNNRRNLDKTMSQIR